MRLAIRPRPGWITLASAPRSHRRSWATRRPNIKREPAKITLDRYTHVLPGELERARDLLDKFLADRVRDEEEAI